MKATIERQFRFVLMEAGGTPIYRLMPELNLIDLDRALQLVQVLQAIAQNLSA